MKYFSPVAELINIRTYRKALRFLMPVVILMALSSAMLHAEVTPDASVLEAEAKRVEVIQRASQASVSVFDATGQGGGSAVLISPDGFAVTNFHVVAPCGAAMKCGLSDGQLYDAVVVGIDPVGDVALIQLLGRDDFPTAHLGDSDEVRVGDWVFTAGNPFLLADDFTPSVSYGMISGVHRYQYPAGTLLEYADCLQTDAAVNPGNSGGALFNEAGELIGVNGRCSFEKRGRVNVGVGYAISINQIERFLSHLKAGRIVDHASLGFTVSTSEIGRVVIDDILETSDAYRRGLRYGDQIVEFGGREIATANALQNALGTYPRDWIVPLVYRREGVNHQVSLRLPGVHDPAQLVDMVQEQKDKPVEPPDGKKPDERKPEEQDQPNDDKEPGQIPNLRDLIKGKDKPEMPEAVRERYEEVRGYANYWYNRRKQEELWNIYRGKSNLEQMGSRWRLAGKLTDNGTFQIAVSDTRGEMRLPTGQTGAVFAGDLASQLSPPGSGGLLLTLHLWQRILERGLARFGEVYYLGELPAGPEGEMVDCLVGLHGGIEFRMLFSVDSGDLVGLEMFPADTADPCVVHFSEFSDLGGKRLPTKWHVTFAGRSFADLNVTEWQFEDAHGEPSEDSN